MGKRIFSLLVATSTKESFISSDVRIYFLTMLGFVINLDYIIEPMLNIYTYSSIWYITGIIINGKPLFLLIEYPLAVSLWIGVTRLVQQKLNLSWRKSFYSTFLGFAFLEELLNQYIIRLWTFSENILWTGNFYLDLIPRFIFRWML